MSFKYEESVLIYQQKYTVQDVSKFPKEDKYMIGTSVLLTDITNSSASITTNGRKKYIPVRALIKVKGFEAKGVRAENADGFAIVAKNTIGLPVGMAFIGPESIQNDKAIFTIDGKQIRIPLNICCSLVRIKEKVSKKIVKETITEDTNGIPTEVIQTIDASSLRQDIDGIPESVLRLLPNVNIKDIKEVLYTKTQGVYSDYNGEIHETLAACDKANTVIRHKMIQEICNKRVADKINSQWEDIRK